MLTVGSTALEGYVDPEGLGGLSGAFFDQWSDGVTTANRTINVSRDMTLTASFKVADSTETPGGEDDNEGYIKANLSN